MSTEILTIDEVTSSQSDKFTTHNNGLRQLEGQTIRVLSRTNAGPPGSPTNGDTYIVDVASGTWASATVLDIAHYYGGAWNFYTPVQGVRLDVNDEDVIVKFDGVDWDTRILTGASTLTDGGVLLGGGTGDITAMAVLADGEMIVGDGTTAPVAESGATLRTSIGLGTGDSPTFAGLTSSSVVSVDDVTDSSSTTTGSIHTDGGLGVVKKSFFGDNISVTGQGLFTLPDNTANAFDIVEGANEYLSIDTTDGSELITFGGGNFVFSTGMISTGGETSPDVTMGGLTLKQSATAFPILTLKSSGVTHPFTALRETDTYASISSYSAASGGVYIRGFTEDAIGFSIQGVAVTTTTDPYDFTNKAPITLISSKSNGATSTTSLSDNELVFSITNNGTLKSSVMGNGDYYTQGSVITGGETSPDVDAGGLCLQQGANDGNIISLKSSDVAHGITVIAETDTFALMKKDAATTGGLNVDGISSAGTGLTFRGLATSVSTSDTGRGCVDIYGAKKSGTGLAVLADTENLNAFSNGGTVKAVIKGNGDIVSQGGLRVGGGTDILDTYEEGTWTPELWDSTLATEGTPPTYSVQVGTYTRVGDVVHIQGRIQISSLGGLATGQVIRLGALPFASENTTDSYPALTVGRGNGLNVASGGTVGGWFTVGTSYITLTTWDSTVGTTDLLVSEFSATGDIMFSATYKV